MIGDDLKVRAAAAVSKEGFVVSDGQGLLGLKCISKQALYLVLGFLVSSINELLCEFLNGKVSEKELYPLIKLSCDYGLTTQKCDKLHKAHITTT